MGIFEDGMKPPYKDGKLCKNGRNPPFSEKEFQEKLFEDGGFKNGTEQVSISTKQQMEWNELGTRLFG
jgi:hypothetical protein